MAYSVGSMSVYDTSDELTDTYCDPCFKDGTIRSVAGYCQKCVEFYCHTCLAAHRRMAATERHKILLGPDMPACQTDKPLKYQQCDKHEDEVKDSYCFDHGITTCEICFVTEHKHCHVKEVSEACKSFNMSAEKMSFSADVGLLLKHVKKTRKATKSNIARLEKTKQVILSEARKQRDQLLEKVNQSYQTFSGEVTSLLTDRITTLSERQTALDGIVTEVNTILQSLQQRGPKIQNDQNEFLKLHHSAEQIRFCEDKIKQLSLKQIDISYILNTEIQPLIETRNRFGKYSLKTAAFQYSTERPSIRFPCTVSRPDPHKGVPRLVAIGGHVEQSVKLTPLEQIKVKTPKDKKHCLISGIDITADGNMVLADQNNCKVKLFSPGGKLLSYIKDVERVDVAVINKSEAAISRSYRCIDIIDIADCRQIVLKRSIRTQSPPWGITAFNDNLIIACAERDYNIPSVQMIDMAGKVQWLTASDLIGKSLFDWISSITPYSDDDYDKVIVTDEMKQAITILEAGTGRVVKICNIKGKRPRCATVDDHRNVYVCYDTGEITVWSRDMQSETRLTTESEYLKLPLAMAYNSKLSELVVTSVSAGNDRHDFLHRYKVSVM